MTATTQRADRGEKANPRDAIACAVCRRKIPRDALHNVLSKSEYVLCSSCLGRISLHRRFYPQCPHDFHDLLDHPVTSCTRAAARQYLKERSKK